MKSLRSIIAMTVFSFILGTAVAQQVPMYSQYIMNGFLINPSLAGRDGYSTVNLTVREQWVGMKGAPSTYAASFQTSLVSNSFNSRTKHARKKLFKIPKDAKVGLGGYLFNDNNGMIHRTGLQAAYAYHISMGQAKDGISNSLSFGLALTAYQHSINEKDLLYSYNDDPYLNAYDRSVFITDVNFGVSYAASSYYLGFAMTNILRGSLVFGNSSDNKTGELGYFFLTGGYNFPLDAHWTLKPSAFIKSSDMLFKSTQLDLTTRIYYRDSYWAGLSFRTNDAIIAMIGLKYKMFYFAYAFDVALTDIRKQTLGTHELTLAFKFGEVTGRYRWLNSF
jgi:type IX secretion system PorP/SprF family membrane protein